MTKKLHSILEMATAIVGLIAAPIVVLASLDSIVLSDRTEPASVIMVHDTSAQPVHIAELKL